MWERDGSSYSAQATGLGIDEVEEVVASLTAISVDEWAERYGQIDGPDGDIELAEGCPLPELTIGGP